MIIFIRVDARKPETWWCPEMELVCLLDEEPGGELVRHCKSCVNLTLMHKSVSNRKIWSLDTMIGAAQSEGMWRQRTGVTLGNESVDGTFERNKSKVNLDKKDCYKIVSMEDSEDGWVHDVNQFDEVESARNGQALDAAVLHLGRESADGTFERNMSVVDLDRRDCCKSIYICKEEDSKDGLVQDFDQSDEDEGCGGKVKGARNMQAFDATILHWLLLSMIRLWTRHKQWMNR